MTAGDAQITVAEIMRPPLTTVEQDGHLAGAAYLMKHAGATALVVLDAVGAGHPIGVITEADIVGAVADEVDLTAVRIRDRLTARPTVVEQTARIQDAADLMLKGHFRHLPVVDGGDLVGMVDIGDVCRALLYSSEA